MAGGGDGALAVPYTSGRSLPEFRTTNPMTRRILLLALVWALCGAAAAWAQSPPGIKTSQQTKMERLAENHWRLTGNVEGEISADNLKFAADVVDYYTDHPRRLVGTGHVVVITTDMHISADRADINTEAKTGVFYNAFGTVNVSEKEIGARSLFGTQEPIAYFYGDTIERVGVDKYKISHGGFTTCVQPTPRWELVSSSTMLRVDKYAFLKNTVLKVKDVPLFYLPAMYYPINKDDRSTGFLIPSYGSTTLHGQSISNAFFWAINRSSDATVVHDLYPTSGQGYGGEYRYITAPGSNGNFRFYRLQEKAASDRPQRQSFQVVANAVQKLPFHLTARANINYFSDVTVQQQYQMDLYSATLRNRTYGGNVAGAWGRDSLSFTYQINEIFYNETDSQEYGNKPRLTYTRAATPIGNTGLLFQASAEGVKLERLDKLQSGAVEYDRGYTRWDASPSLIYPFTALPFLNVRSSITWHNTYYGQSWDRNSISIDEPVTRQYFELASRIVGPTFSRVWNTPDNGYAEKFKHVIEPELTISRTTAFDDYAKIPKVEGYDFVFGETTRYTYGVTQRVLAKRKNSATPGQTTELLNIQVQQSYYSNPAASQVDSSYSGSFLGRKPSKYSPIALTVRASPTQAVGATLRVEYNKQQGEIETIQANGNIRVGGWLDTSNGYSQRKYFDFLDPTRAFTNFLNSTTRVHLKDGKVIGSYAFDMNVKDASLIQQRIGIAYNAQCCGIAFDYQAINYPNSSRFLVPQDRRFNISFTLAGIGSFSNFLGAFGIGQGANGTYGTRY
jgi:LPS-assembly protein